ncbi:MAG: hypothetical protein ACI9MR_002634 [Myxococcota bacterium]|jgi:hypothetical protein
MASIEDAGHVSEYQRNGGSTCLFTVVGWDTAPYATAGIRAANVRLRKGKLQVVKAQWEFSDLAPTATPAPGTLTGGATVGREGPALVVRRGATLNNATTWRYDPTLNPVHDLTSVAVYALGTDRVYAVFDDANDGYVTHDRRHVILHTKPSAPGLPVEAKAYERCSNEALCPLDYDRSWPYLDVFCRDVLTPATLEGLAADASSGKIGSRDLMMLFNAHGALHGYRFKKQKWLNAFFYGKGAKRWLPPVCTKRFASFDSAKVVPASFGKARGKLKALWRKFK